MNIPFHIPVYYSVEHSPHYITYYIHYHYHYHDLHDMEIYCKKVKIYRGFDLVQTSLHILACATSPCFVSSWFEHDPGCGLSNIKQLEKSWKISTRIFIMNKLFMCLHDGRRLKYSAHLFLINASFKYDTVQIIAMKNLHLLGKIWLLCPRKRCRWPRSK